MIIAASQFQGCWPPGRIPAGGQLGVASRIRAVAAASCDLDGRAVHRAKRAKDTAVAGLRPQQFATAHALVEVQARIGWHDLGVRESAIRAGKGRHEDRRGIHGQRIPATKFVMASLLARSRGISARRRPPRSADKGKLRRAVAPARPQPRPGQSSSKYTSTEYRTCPCVPEHNRLALHKRDIGAPLSVLSSGSQDDVMNGWRDHGSRRALQPASPCSTRKALCRTTT